MALNLKELVAKANANRAILDGATEPIERIFENNDVVIGVWQDATEPQGVGTLIMKGEAILETIKLSGVRQNVRLDAIPCQCYEQAFVAKRMFGDLARVN